MQCNIDARGKAMRILSGTFFVIVGLVLLAAAWYTATGWLWVAAIVALLGGAFQIYEGRKGWCAMRAMGFKTPI